MDQCPSGSSCPASHIFDRIPLSGVTHKSPRTHVTAPLNPGQRSFRQRNLELEAETRHLQQQLSSMRNDLDTMRSDNIKLYEKIKFVSTYQNQRQAEDSTTRRYGAVPAVLRYRPCPQAL